MTYYVEKRKKQWYDYLDKLISGISLIVSGIIATIASAGVGAALGVGMIVVGSGLLFMGVSEIISSRTGVNPLCMLFDLSRSSFDKIGTALKIIGVILQLAYIAYNIFAPSPKCFAAGTLVHTSEGLKPIENVEVGDYVLSYDEESGNVKYKSVLQLLENELDLRTILTIKADDGNIEEVVSTTGHKYYLLDNKQKRNANEKLEHASYERLADKFESPCVLKKGDKVLLEIADYLTDKPKYGIIVDVKNEKCEKFTTYNFEAAASLFAGRLENSDNPKAFDGRRTHLTSNDKSEPIDKAKGWCWQKVTRVFRNTTTEWVHVEVKDDKITCTGEHPFYVLSVAAGTPIIRFEGRDDSKYAGQWVSAKNLKAGFEFMLSNGETATVQKITIENLNEPQTIYNFEVEENHTYCVGNNGVLVHNACPKINGQDVYRGHPRNPELGVFEAVPDELVIENGLVTSNGGVSVHTNAGALKRFRKVYVIDSMPDGLVFTPNAAGHNLIVPQTPMSLSNYQRLLSQITYRPFP